MKKKVFSLLLILCLVLGLAGTAFAQSYNGKAGWKVTFTADEKMESNFQSTEISDALRGLQPGDDMTLTIELSNEFKEAVDWYLMNDVLKSLEDNSTASNGVYTYILSYKSSSGTERELYNSDAVGGTRKEDDKSPTGLHAATNSLAEYLFLDTIAHGAKGTVILKVALDGETQGNRYQSTFADIRLRFAVETATSVIKTGDTSNGLPFYIALGVSGAAIILIVIIAISRRKRREGQA